MFERDQHRSTPTRRTLLTTFATASVASVATAAALPTPAVAATATSESTATALIVDAIAVGADPLGQADSTAVLRNALVTALAQSRVTMLRFPPGKYRVRPGLLAGLDFGGLTIAGAGVGATRIAAMATGDDTPLFDLRASSTLVTDLSITAEPGAGCRALIEVNASYCEIRSVTLRKAPGTAIAFGREANATCNRVHGVIIRDSAVNGIDTSRAHLCSDSILDSIDVGRSGAYGIFLATGSQTMQSVHAWGSGRTAPNRGHGITILGNDCSLVNCQSETNMGLGIFCQGDNNSVVGGRYWGNGWAGIGGAGDRLSVTGASIYRNGIRGRGSDPRGSGICNEGGTGWTLSGLSIFDDGKAVKPLASDSAERSDFPGRNAGRKTQTYAIANMRGARTSVAQLSLAAHESASGKTTYRQRKK